ncbi:transcriptional regulator [Candidatus Accumulibacter phosphatis]|jgi:DNA-binding transcriptional ArsR family regulator|uniref:Transcriptional regulator n=1 Tax=Candidatus Accumulibacter phosphatis TaxID=327160 RepID=A0ABX1TSU5_9PROT|nr:nucleotidyltransferase domain-containing protein [Candidatus Accumulibacter phosphatis]NMQ27312.1 transcriptional regulator [Candidatus Accumulibacter phosphatis]
MSNAASKGIANALFSRTLSGVLALLFGQPGSSFYTREIVRRVGTGGSQVHKDLERLTAAGLILREPRGNLVFYRANPDAAVYPELVGLVGKSFGIADQLRHCLEPVVSRIRCAIIFGSVARGEQRADSDVDLLLIGEIRLSELAVPLHEAEEALGMHISPTLMSAEEYKLRRQNDDYFLKNVLTGELITLWGSLEPTVAS